jgi:hypothetical protein
MNDGYQAGHAHKLSHVLFREGFEGQFRDYCKVFFSFDIELLLCSLSAVEIAIGTNIERGEDLHAVAVNQAPSNPQQSTPRPRRSDSEPITHKSAAAGEASVTFRKTGTGWIRTNLATELQCPSNPSVT